MENSDEFRRFNDSTTGLEMLHTQIMPELMNEDEEEDIIVHMDLREPILNLRNLVEKSTGMQLGGYEFWLQDSQMLEPHKNLVDQCVQGEGLVQINVQIQTENRRINIVDVLKPTEDVLTQLQEADRVAEESIAVADIPSGENDQKMLILKQEKEFELPIPAFQISKVRSPVSMDTTTPSTSTLATAKAKQEHGCLPHRTAPVATTENNVTKINLPTHKSGSSSRSSSSTSEEPPKKKNVIRWFVDNHFKQDQLRMKIPENPEEWTHEHVKHWLQWAVQQFNLNRIKLEDWHLNGKQLCSITIQDFQKRVPSDPNDIFWTHLELLRKCKFVATIQKQASLTDYLPVVERQPGIHKKMPKLNPNGDDQSPLNSPIGNRTGNNGQIQLWQFLLELLTSKDHREIIQWLGNDGEFKLLNAEMVAQLWGERKNKTNMTYEKLSRALRYYYDGDMISKVNGKRFTYRFVCDLKELIGYDAQELARLVEESDDKRRIYDENSLQLD